MPKIKLYYLTPRKLQRILDWADHLIMCGKLDDDKSNKYNWMKVDGETYYLIEQEIKSMQKIQRNG